MPQAGIASFGSTVGARLELVSPRAALHPAVRAVRVIERGPGPGVTLIDAGLRYGHWRPERRLTGFAGLGAGLALSDVRVGYGLVIAGIDVRPGKATMFRLESQLYARRNGRGVDSGPGIALGLMIPLPLR